MSKSSTASSTKPLPAKSAWLKGPPQTSAPSPRSQSPAPSAPSQPHLTHSRRPSALGQAVPIKDGVSIPRSNVGAAAAKQGSPVTFGSIDDASAPMSSSPAAPNPIKESVVKSFGTVPAAPATASSHINGKPSISASRPAGASFTAPSTSSSPGLSASTSVSATPPSSGPKLEKPDIKKLFQSPSAPAVSSNETQSPSLRSATLPSQGQNQPSSSQPSQFGAHFTPFVPNRPPAPSGPNNASRSPVYQRQMQNGNGPRSQPPNGGPTGLPSPRLGPPHTPQQAGPQPPAPVQGQVQQPAYWGGYYQYPPEYMNYPPWGYVPGMPPQSAHPHPQHHPQPPHMPPHTTMPMSPRNAPQHLPGTPTMSHAQPNLNHPPHPPPPLSHANTLNNVSSPPPTPSSARLNASSSAFVPRPSSKIVLKNSEGKEVALESLTSKVAVAGAPISSGPSSGQGSPYRGSSPSTPKRASIRMETEEQRKQRVAVEEEKEKEKQRLQAEAEEKIRKQKEEEERKAKEEEEREQKRRAEEEQELVRKAEEERQKREEEERKAKEAAERLRLEKEEEERKVKEAEAAKLREEEERLAKLKAEEERVAKEEAERQTALEEQKKAEEAKKQQEEEAAKAKAAESTPVPEEGEVADAAAATTATQDDSKKPKESLRIDTTTTSNPADLGRRRPGPLDLSAAKTSRQSSLSTARNIVDINGVKYPEGIQSPKPELNEGAQAGQFRYDRDFLLQFMTFCKEKPPNLPSLDAIGLEPMDQHHQHPMTRPQSGRGSRNVSSSAPSRQPSGGLSFGPSGLGKPGSGFAGMGNFATKPLTSEDRFAMANAGNRAVSGSAAGSIPFGRGAGAIQRTPSQPGRERTRSKRGEKRPPAEGGRSGFQHDRGQSYAQQNAQQMDLGPVAPLQPTANRWDRKIVGAVDQDSPELVDRKVKGLLNKLTMEKFDSISDQIITWANKSEQEKDGRTLIQVIRLVFEKATDEAAWSEMYARLCRKMMERISPKVQDDGIINAEGKPIAGGQLFRKYLLNRCQEDFERGWVAKEATALAAASKAADDDAVKAANQGKDEETEEVALYSDEYYAAQKAKRQGLGLIKFIGELFKLQMLTERIMHECVKKLLGNVENPEEEEIESLCKLLATVGALLDTQKARAHMDIYFSRMKELTKSPNVSSRMQFMLQDLLELRDRKWIPRNAAAAPTTLAQVHENAAKEKAANDKESFNRQSGMSRTSSNRGRGRNDFEQLGPDGWAVAGGAPNRPPPKAGDLTNFGKITKTQAMTFGPTSVFSAKNKDSKREQPISRSSSNSNMFSMLSQQADATPEAKSEPTQRRRLVLQPRTVPKEDDAPTASASQAGSENSSDDDEAPDATAAAAAPELSDAEAGKKIDEDIKELFAVRNLEEAEVYFTTLPSNHHQTLIDKLVTKAVESKATDAELVANFFERASSKELCSASAFETGFESIAEFIYDVALDAPKAPQLFAQMVKAAGLSEQARQQLASKSSESDQLLTLLS